MFVQKVRSSITKTTQNTTYQQLNPKQAVTILLLYLGIQKFSSFLWKPKNILQKIK